MRYLLLLIATGALAQNRDSHARRRRHRHQRRNGRNVIDDPTYTGDVKALRARMESFFDRVQAPKLEDWRSTTRQQLPVCGR